MVVAVETDAQGGAVGEENTAGALDLQHEGIDRAAEISGDWGLAVEGVIVDGSARQGGEIEVERFGVEGDGVAGAEVFGAGVFGLEIAGDEGLAGDGVDAEIALEEISRGGVVAGRDGLGCGAAGLPETGLAGGGLGHVVAAQSLIRGHMGDGLAAQHEGGQRGGDVVLRPAG